MERTNLLSTQQRMAQSARTGLHATVYEVQRDPKLKNKDVIRDKTKPVFPFVNGAKYKGQWLNDKKNGFGIQINPNDTKYEGEWSNDKYHGRGTLYVMNSKKKYSRLYVGDWAYGFMEGEGVYYFSDGSTYQGEWKDNKKCGKGTLTLTNGDLYNGEWMDDLKHGFGTLFYDNGNIYEGLWANGMKEGPGLFYYASTQKVKINECQ